MEDYEVADQLKPWLTNGETLLWTGRPRQGMFLQASDAFMIPFSFLWGGFALFWEGTVITTNAPLLFKLWGIPFVCVGLYMIIGRFFGDAYMRSKTSYGLTETSALIFKSYPGGKFNRIDLTSGIDISVQQTAPGRGTISFGGPPGSFASSFTNASRQPAVPAFLSIEDVDRVYKKIQDGRTSRKLGAG